MELSIWRNESGPERRESSAGTLNAKGIQASRYALLPHPETIASCSSGSRTELPIPFGMTAKKTAFAYIRVSSQGQQDGHGFDRQIDTIGRFAKGARLQVVDTFKDSHTGTEADRPGFSAMVAALKSNGTRTVIIESLDRLARSLSVQIALLSLLEQEGITLLSASTGQDVTADIRDDPMREAMVMMQGVFAQTEKKLLVRKLRKARDKMRATGVQVEGQRPFGAKPGEQETIARILALHAEKNGLGDPKNSLADIAAKLTEEGHKTRRGGKWTRQSVFEILKRS